MVSNSPKCAILADRHTLLAEGIRDLLETAFQTVYLVADTPTLREGTSRLLPALIVLDMSLAGHNSLRVLQQIRELSPASRVLVLSMHDDAAVARMALSAGAHGVVLKRSIGEDFMHAVDAVLQGVEYVSPDIDMTVCVH